MYIVRRSRTNRKFVLEEYDYDEQQWATEWTNEEERRKYSKIKSESKMFATPNVCVCMYEWESVFHLELIAVYIVISCLCYLDFTKICISKLFSDHFHAFDDAATENKRFSNKNTTATEHNKKKKMHNSKRTSLVYMYTQTHT